MGSGNVKVGESEAQDVATSLPAYLRIALESRTYVIAEFGPYYIQFHGGPAPKLFAELVHDRYLVPYAPAWSHEATETIRSWGYEPGNHNYQRMYDEGDAQISDAASTAQAFFLNLVGAQPGALIEYWMGHGDLGSGPSEVEVHVREPEAKPTLPRSELAVAPVLGARKSAVSTRYKESNP